MGHRRFEEDSLVDVEKSQCIMDLQLLMFQIWPYAGTFQWRRFAGEQTTKINEKDRLQAL
ncbi:hypothetical protein A3197_20710 [Candidatus Thiodiazotropha endoloripes]|nr:hypothetical protein A3197_20710 [Candidatus Thiodiazotropha endoloripes]